MNTNHTKLFIKTILTIICAFAASAAMAETYTLKNGDVHEGVVYKIIAKEVYLKKADGKVTASLSDFDSSSRKAIKAWAADNPLKVDVYTRWDSQPVIKSSVMPGIPEALFNPDFKGMVSVDLVLDESGQVIHAAIKKSTHVELETPAIEAAKTWLFEPAIVGGKSVRAKLRVPFKFIYTPPKPAESAPAA